MCVAFKKLVALCVPFLFIWLFSACVWLCTHESVEIQTDSEITSRIEMNGSPCCHGCPLTTPPQAATRERGANDFSVGSPVAMSSLPASSNINFACVASRAFLQEFAAPSPPQRLPNLRI